MLQDAQHSHRSPALCREQLGVQAYDQRDWVRILWAFGTLNFSPGEQLFNALYRQVRAIHDDATCMVLVQPVLAEHAEQAEMVAEAIDLAGICTTLCPELWHLHNLSSSCQHAATGRTVLTPVPALRRCRRA